MCRASAEGVSHAGALLSRPHAPFALFRASFTLRDIFELATAHGRRLLGHPRRLKPRGDCVARCGLLGAPASSGRGRLLVVVISWAAEARAGLCWRRGAEQSPARRRRRSPRRRSPQPLHGLPPIPAGSAHPSHVAPARPGCPGGPRPAGGRCPWSEHVAVQDGAGLGPHRLRFAVPAFKLSGVRMWALEG